MSRSKSAKLWRERLRRFKSANMTVAEFCRSECVSLAAYYYWKKKLRIRLTDSEHSDSEKSDSEYMSSMPPPQFMPVRLATERLATEHVAAERLAGGDLTSGHADGVELVDPESESQSSSGLACTTIELPGGIRIRVEAPTRQRLAQPGE